MLRFLNYLTIAFIVLRLCNVIDWDWVLVLMPTITAVLIWIAANVILAILKEKYPWLFWKNNK